MDDANKKRMAILFEEECRLFWQYIQMKLHIISVTDEEKVKWHKDWKFVTDEIQRLKDDGNSSD
jgi:hypothetical protein